MKINQTQQNLGFGSLLIKIETVDSHNYSKMRQKVKSILDGAEVAIKTAGLKSPNRAEMHEYKSPSLSGGHALIRFDGLRKFETAIKELIKSEFSYQVYQSKTLKVDVMSKADAKKEWEIAKNKWGF